MNTLPPPSANKPWRREQLLIVLRTALKVEAYRYADQAALAWLTHYENDLEVQYLRARALIGLGQSDTALSILETVCRFDPEYLEAQELRARTLLSRGVKGITEAHGCVLALQEETSVGQKHNPPAPPWALPLREARQALRKGAFDAATEHLTAALAAEKPPALVAVTHLKSLWLQNDTPPEAIRSLGEHYQQQWPQCVTLNLLLADSMIRAGASDQAVELLHRAAASDPAGQVAQKLWGQRNPYAALWPDDMEAPVDLPVPAAVAAALGWNLLPQGEITPQEHPPAKAAAPPAEETPLEAEQSPLPPSPPAVDTPPAPSTVPQKKPPKPRLEELRAEALRLLEVEETDIPAGKSAGVQAELEKAARRLRRPSLARADGRHPIYVVLSTRGGLERQYGARNAALIDKTLEKLVLTLRERRGWGALLMYPDDPAAMSGLNLKPTPSTDPWAIKLALADLESALRAKDAMIGALLIVGGPEVVPFHHLPNPTDDLDADVPSDNPYATPDENYFVPRWPVGRIPGGAGNQPDLLLGYLRRMIRYHQMQNLKPGQMKTWLTVLREMFSRLLPGRRTPHSIGYSAEIWQRAAMAVYRVLDEPRRLVTSPPQGSHSRIPAPAARLGYFNLHGMVDAAEWYGQRDPTNYPKPGVKPIEEGPDFPIALRPEDVVNSGRAPQVVFSEACYGAHIYNRKVEESLALKFLASGSRAVIGSTAIAYGSVAAPLIAADLLGKGFWRYLQEGFPVGEALRRAKISLVQQMQKRQGYLDGEDQKTLISFVLYGDPLARPETLPLRRQAAKDVLRLEDALPAVKTVCDLNTHPDEGEPIPDEILETVRQAVAHYLPGMEKARITLCREHLDCEGHSCPSGQLGAKTRPDSPPRRKVVVLSQKRHDAYRVHPTFARLTLDEEGKVVKLAVSR
ncbi:MAG: hypothetical protein D6803_01700 [Anaerolineae bacterium]|nr:MAG: hypothetical protein D6803_01700 [Anaerolineae bacterium]